MPRRPWAAASPSPARPGAAGHLALALVAVERGDPTTARAHLNDAERSVGARHDPFVATFVPLLRAVEHADGRDFRRALAALDRVPTAVPNRAMPVWLADRVALTAAAVHLERGDAPAAEAALGTVRNQSTGWAVARARLALAGGRVPEAEELLAPVLVDRSADQEDARIAAWLLSARIHQRNGQVIGARAALGEALDLARPERRRRLLLRPGPLGRDLLASFPDVASAHPWLGGPARGRGAGDGAAELAEPPLEPLTERERAVLACMAQAMSVEDIANDLFISVNTVKTHQRGIYRKLRVSRRNDAVRRARQLGLV
nr:LuxR C-terminal-related transcriptional regulator [Blastococcus sp. TF02A-30]